MVSTSSVRLSIGGPHIVHETIEGEVVAINLDTGSYYSLENVGADVWGLIETGTTIDQIVEHINRRYDGGRPNVERAVVHFIEVLRQEGLIATDGTQETKLIAGPAKQDETGPELKKCGFEAPVLRKYTDMQELILLDPIHEVDEAGWPNRKPERATAD